MDKLIIKCNLPFYIKVRILCCQCRITGSTVLARWTLIRIGFRAKLGMGFILVFTRFWLISIRTTLRLWSYWGSWNIWVLWIIRNNQNLGRMVLSGNIRFGWASIARLWLSHDPIAITLSSSRRYVRFQN